uniref:Reverse transcriptase domain-containing protein n=1 Tax=Lactuca sativa TaxID=4236 RepID=A0A9R1XNV8_LACSA|nr:hypothetical protein LSAT_V11C200066830 [Lactuca sativa]
MSAKNMINRRIGDQKNRRTTYSIVDFDYADDALFLGEWSKGNIKNLARILRCFHVSSGLKVNFYKSRVFGVGATLEETYRHLVVKPLLFLSHLWGVPVGANMNQKKKLEANYR